MAVRLNHYKSRRELVNIVAVRVTKPSAILPLEAARRWGIDTSGFHHDYSMAPERNPFPPWKWLQLLHLPEQKGTMHTRCA